VSSNVFYIFLNIFKVIWKEKRKQKIIRFEMETSHLILLWMQTFAS